MPIKVQCKECNAVMSVKDEAAGKAVKCRECGARVKVPAGRPKTPNLSKAARPAPPPEDDPWGAHAGDALDGLDLRNAEHADRRVCPSCATPVALDAVECHKCGVTIATGVLSERQRMIRERKGPPPEEFYGAVWRDGSKFLGRHIKLALSTAFIWTMCLTMSFTSLYCMGWSFNSRVAELRAQVYNEAEGTGAREVTENYEERCLVISVTESSTPKYDGHTYMYDPAEQDAPIVEENGEKIQKYREPLPEDKARSEPPFYFWMAMFCVFQLGFGGWAWTVATKIAEATMAGQKKLKNFKPDFFGNLSMGFRFYVWPLVLLAPIAWLPLLFSLLNLPIVTAICLAGIYLMAMLLFLPAAVVHMTQPFQFRAWLIYWMARDFFKTIGPSLYVGAMNLFLVGLIPLGLAITFLIFASPLIAWGLAQINATLVWLNENLLDMGDGMISFVFYLVPLVFIVLFILFGTLCTLMAFPTIFMMRVIGLYGKYFKPDLSLVKEVVAGENVGFGPRWLAYLIDYILIVAMIPVAMLVGYLSTFLFRLWGVPSNIVAGVANLVTTLFHSLMVLQYFAAGESGAARGSLGKWSLGMIVLREDDRPMKRGEAYTRALSAWLCSIPLYAGFIASAFRRDGKALHDVMSHSKVVWREEEFKA